MLKKILIFLVLLVVLLIGVGMVLPKTVHVERSVQVDAPAATVYTLLNGYGRFNEWSPWARRDPNAVYEHQGPASGVGAKMSWSGNNKVGTGSQEITGSQPYERIDVRLDFGPQGIADAYYRLNEADGGTHLTWGFDTNVVEGRNFVNGLIGRYIGLMFDKWIGADYEEGLSNFKTLAESFPKADFSDMEIEVMDVAPVDILYVSGESSQEADDIARALAQAYGEVATFMHGNAIPQQGPPMAITRRWDEQGYGFDAAIPGNLPPEAVLSGNVKAGQSPTGRAVRGVHLGGYDAMMPSYEKIMAYMAVHGLDQGEVSWEQYMNDPAEVAEGQQVTHIYFQIAQ